MKVIMKKTFSTIAAFCIGLLVSISIYACADDFKDPSLMGSEELESLKEVVMKYNEKVEKFSEEVSKLTEEVSTLKTIVEQQKVQIAELTENVALSGKRELITGFSQTYQEFGKAHSDSYSFEYDNDGRITRITFRGDDGSSTTSLIISYTDTECIISESDGGSVVVTIATTSNDIATINMLIWANILNEFL
jgi:hypothetical protein